MKIILILLLSYFSVDSNAAEDSYISELSIVDTFMGNRRTNVGLHATLYPIMNLPLAINCHPYNPNDVAGNSAPACVSHPLVVRYHHPAIVREILPESIRTRLDAAGATCQLYLNVQDNPWNGTQVLIRAHAFSEFFPAMGGNYQGVGIIVCRGDGSPLLDSTSSVHLHDGVASPNNFPIAGLNHAQNEDFYSIVTYGGRTVITHHILLTVPARVLFQDLLCASSVHDRSPSFFSPLLGTEYSAFLGENGIA